jgi:hypothetical protein
MSYRTIEIRWTPRTTTEWAAFSVSRKEAARLWNDLVVRHHRIRRLNWRWPGKARWQRWAITPKRRYPNLSAQSAQQIIGEFCEAVDSCRQLRRNGHGEMRYPWRLRRYDDVVYTNQDARIRDGRLVLPHGAGRTLRIPVPDAVALPGRLMEVRLSYGVARLICEAPDVRCPQGDLIGVDLGVNTLIAASDGRKSSSSVGAPPRRQSNIATSNSLVCSRRRQGKSKGLVATGGYNGANIGCWTRRSDVSAICAIRRRDR